MEANSLAKRKPQITRGKFQNVDLRVAKVISAPEARGTPYPCRVITLDAGSLGQFVSVGQFVLIPEEELVGRKVLICCNLGERDIGDYRSEVLVLGAHHPESPENQSQAIPFFINDMAECGDEVF